LLVNNAGISNTRRSEVSAEEYAKSSKASTASLDEMHAVWDTNVFGTLAVYQAMLPLLRESSDARIVNVSSGVGSLALNAVSESRFRQVVASCGREFSGNPRSRDEMLSSSHGVP
jgi:NAD(P)-dependent dehydrogenase (short-subunit alcohol dehydrogenase family)